MKRFLLFFALLLTVVTLASCNKKPAETSATTDYIPNNLPQQTLATDYKPPVFPETGLYIDYVANSSVAGTVEGGGTHRVDGRPAGKVTAIPNLGYRFVRWSDGKTDPVRQGDTVEKSTQIIAIFDYAPLELPILHITTETGWDVESKTEYINATLSLSNASEKYCLDNLEMQIRGRGNKTWEYEKKSYKMKLSEKQSLLGLGEGKSKKWVLLANVCDQSLLRNYASLLLADSMPYAVWSPDTTSVEVYLNGEYRGVYLLCEEIDANKNKIDVPEDLTGMGSEDIGFLVEISGNPKSPQFSCNDRKYQIHNDLSTDTAEANAQKQYISNYIRSAWEAVQEGDEAKIAELIDINSLVNAYLLEETLKNLDCGYDSFYLYRQAGGKLVFGPVWDFDNALGNADEGTQYYYDLYVAYNERFQSNPWLYTAMEHQWFRERVLKMWDESKDVRSKLSATVIKVAKEGYNSYCRNFDKWDLFGQQWNRETEQITSLENYTEHYEFLASWIDQRMAWMDEFYHKDTFITDWDNTPINPENPNPGWPDRPSQPETPDRPVISQGIGNEAAKELMESHNSVAVRPGSVSTTKEGFDFEGVDCLFDDDVNTKYCVSVGRGGGWWGQQQTPGEVEITFALTDAKALSGYAFFTANDTSEYPERNPNAWVLYGKGADGKFVELSKSTSDEAGMGAHDFTAYGVLIENAAAYSEYKLVITHAGTLQLGELMLFTK
jgi:spore coat protein CotH